MVVLDDKKARLYINFKGILKLLFYGKFATLNPFFSLNIKFVFSAKTLIL